MSFLEQLHDLGYRTGRKQSQQNLQTKREPYGKR